MSDITQEQTELYWRDLADRNQQRIRELEAGLKAAHANQELYAGRIAKAREILSTVIPPEISQSQLGMQIKRALEALEGK